MKKFLLPIIAFIIFPNGVSADTFYLYFGTYQSKERTNKIEASPSLHALPFSSLEKCESAGEEIFKQIYKPVKFLDGKWICVEK